MTQLTLSDLLKRFKFKGLVLSGNMAGNFELDVLKYYPDGNFIAEGTSDFTDALIYTGIKGNINLVTDVSCRLEFQQSNYLEEPANMRPFEYMPNFFNSKGVYLYRGSLTKRKDNIVMGGEYTSITDFTKILPI